MPHDHHTNIDLFLYRSESGDAAGGHDHTAHGAGVHHAQEEEAARRQPHHAHVWG